MANTKIDDQIKSKINGISTNAKNDPKTPTNAAKSLDSSSNQRSYTRAEQTPDYQRRIMESILENEMAMEQNEATKSMETKSSLLNSHNETDRISNGENAHENVKQKENVVNKIVVKPVDDIFITNCNTEKKEGDKDTSSKNVMEFIRFP